VFSWPLTRRKSTTRLYPLKKAFQKFSWEPKAAEPPSGEPRSRAGAATSTRRSTPRRGRPCSLAPAWKPARNAHPAQEPGAPSSRVREGCSVALGHILVYRQVTTLHREGLLPQSPVMSMHRDPAFRCGTHPLTGNHLLTGIHGQFSSQADVDLHRAPAQVIRHAVPVAAHIDVTIPVNESLLPVRGIVADLRQRVLVQGFTLEAFANHLPHRAAQPGIGVIPQPLLGKLA
jgi:hypothetical protein